LKALVKLFEGVIPNINVIEEPCREFDMAKDFLDKCLKRSWCIIKTEGHVRPFVQIKRCGKSSFLAIFFSYSNVLETIF
jgi:hypothetical protein